MFKFDIEAMVSEVLSLLSKRNAKEVNEGKETKKRIPTDEVAVHLSQVGYILAKDKDGDFDLDKSVNILKGIIETTTVLNCSPGRNGGVGLVEWSLESAADKPIKAHTALKRELEAEGLDKPTANKVISAYITSLLSGGPTLGSAKEIVEQFNT